jgi:hypothetical protein
MTRRRRAAPVTVADLVGITRRGSPVLRFRSSDHDPWNCSTLPDELWPMVRFVGHCYFYPGRDCPGWAHGQPCGRIGEVIPPCG